MPLAAQGHRFSSLAEVMAKANEEKSGDRLAGLAAADARERVAAKTGLAGVPLGTLAGGARRPRRLLDRRRAAGTPARRSPGRLGGASPRVAAGDGGGRREADVEPRP